MDFLYEIVQLDFTIGLRFYSTISLRFTDVYHKAIYGTKEGR